VHYARHVGALEDKIVQAAVVALLTPVYEAEFLGFSYGFRPGRGQHQ
jgi:RNA-directed DNA polymerase